MSGQIGDVETTAGASLESTTAEQIIPFLYSELRRCAAQMLLREDAGITLDATGLVHEAFIRLKKAASHPLGSVDPVWENHGHFYIAAAEAMRRILVERARRVATKKRGGELNRIGLHDMPELSRDQAESLTAIHDALTELKRHEPLAAQVVELRFFGGLSHQDAAHVLGIGRRQADRLW